MQQRPDGVPVFVRVGNRLVGEQAIPGPAQQQQEEERVYADREFEAAFPDPFEDQSGDRSEQRAQGVGAHVRHAGPAAGIIELQKFHAHGERDAKNKAHRQAHAARRTKTLHGAKTEGEIEEDVGEHVARWRALGPGGKQGVQRAAGKFDEAEIERVQRAVHDHGDQAGEDQRGPGFDPLRQFSS